MFSGNKGNFQNQNYQKRRQEKYKLTKVFSQNFDEIF